jgi:uncharacterized protein
MMSDAAITPDPAQAAPVPPPVAPPRIAAIDTTRGLALLGIMLVNVQFFTGSISGFSSHRPPMSGGVVPAWLDETCFFLQRAFCEGKFFPLYSLLFGAAMVFILESAQRQGRTFWTVYLRRLLFLGAVGFLHGTLLWWGDILFVYAWTGLLLMLLGPRCKGRTLCILGACLIAVGLMLGTLFGLLGLLSSGEVKHVDLPPDVALLPPGQRLLHLLGTGQLGDPSAGLMTPIESDAYRNGPFLDATIVRAFTFLQVTVISFFISVPLIAGMFTLGAGMMKLRFWHGRWTVWHRRLMVLGVFIAVPVSIAGTLVARFGDRPWSIIGGAISDGLVAPLISLGIAAAVVAWVRSGRATPLARTLAVPGSMGLSCYLLTTVLATSVTYYWGLGLWGSFGAAEQVGLCLAIYAVLLVASHLWMDAFTAGPIEWLWKRFAYLRPTPLRRKVSGEPSPNPHPTAGI